MAGIERHEIKGFVHRSSSCCETHGAGFGWPHFFRAWRNIVIDMVRMATRVFNPAYFSAPRRPRPDYVCGECGSTDLDRDDIAVCNERGCGRQSEFKYPLRWDDTEGEYEVASALRCGHESHPDDVVRMPMAWYCRACGHVGDPRDLDQERWESSEGM